MMVRLAAEIIEGTLANTKVLVQTYLLNNSEEVGGFASAAPSSEPSALLF